MPSSTCPATRGALQPASAPFSFCCRSPPAPGQPAPPRLRRPPQPPPPTPAPPRVFTFGTASQPLGLDPALVSDVESYRITRQVLEGLVGVDQTTGQPTPLLATEWDQGDEGRTYTFKLREKVTFQDGTPFDAAAVCTNFNRWFNFPEALRQQAPGTTFKGVFKAHADQAPLSIYKGCTALAPDSVRIDLTQPFTGFLQALTLPAFAISSPQALAAGTRRRPEPEPRRPARVRLRPPPGGHRTVRLQLLGPGQRHPGQQQGLLGRQGADRRPSTSSPTITRRPGCRPCWTARSTPTTPSRWATSTSWSSAASRSSSGTPSPSCTWA